MNRGARREIVLGDDRTCGLFHDLLGALPARFGVRVHGYALMPNHFHLLLESERGELSQAMQHLQAAFTQAFNRLHPGWDGPLFRGRFKNQLVEDDAYWMHLLAYLHLNPVKAGLAPWLDQSRWTSHAAYLGEERRPDWLTTDELLAHFGGARAYLAYTWEVHAGRRAPPAGFDEAKLWTPTRTERARPPAPPPRPLGAEQALAQVLAITGVTEEALRANGRGARGNPARWVAAWWLQRGAGMSLREIGELLDAEVPLVCRWCGRVAKALPGTPVGDWARALREGAEDGTRGQRAKGKS